MTGPVPGPLAFSTLGCPGLPIAEVADIAAAQGFSGVELRAARGEPVHVGLDAAQRRAAATTLRHAGVQALAIASYVTVADPTADDEGIISDGIEHGRLAADIGAAFLRVFPGGPIPRAIRRGSDPDADRAARDADRAGQDAAAVRRLLAIGNALAGTGVTVALETHDSHPLGADAARILAWCPGAGAIWDTLHTWRAGEAPAETLAALGERLAYVQVKSVVSREDLTPVPPGEGAVPLADIAAAVHRAGFRGWVSWEYERAWFPEAPALPEIGARVAHRLRETFDGR